MHLLVALHYYYKMKTAQVKEQCDFSIQYWSEELDKVCTRYIRPMMFGHTSAEHLMQLKT